MTHNNERDELARAIGSIEPALHKLYGHDIEEIADSLLAAGYVKPRQVTTVEEMDKLRFQAVVLDAYGTPYVRERHATNGTRNEWRPAGMSHLEESENILYHGPATVVHAGDPDPAHVGSL